MVKEKNKNIYIIERKEEKKKIKTPDCFVKVEEKKEVTLLIVMYGHFSFSLIFLYLKEIFSRCVNFYIQKSKTKVIEDKEIKKIYFQPVRQLS